MERTRIGRRNFLLAGAATVAGLAGCAEPQVTGIDGSMDPSTVNNRTDTRELAEGSEFTAVYEALIDSVVMVRVFGVDDPFAEDGEGRGQGSGFVYRDEYLVTNEHVVAGAEEVDVQFPDGTWSEVQVLGEDIYSDLAVMETETIPASADPLMLSDRRPVVGQQVLAIGNPLGLEGSMSEGIVSGVNRSLPSPTNFRIPDAVQTDASVNPGNSGGPLVDLDGEVVGVINAGAGDGIGFAISSALTERVVPALIEDGEYEHSYLGVMLRPVEPIVARENDLPEPTGVIIVNVFEDSPADGVLEGSDETTEIYGDEIPIGGDVIVAMDGQEIPDQETLSTFLALETDPGETIEIEVYRDGELTTELLTLGRRPKP